MFLNSAIVYLFATCWTSVVSNAFDYPYEEAWSKRIARCYDERGKAQKCSSYFANVAFQSKVDATNTCGQNGPEEYCQQTGTDKTCEFCDSNSFPPSHLTDFHSRDVRTSTWWQSSTMLKDAQWPTSINLTLNLGRAYELNYVRVIFHSSRPESFAIYKRTKLNGPWVPYQFYSSSCQHTYSMHPNEIIKVDNEAKATCNDDNSDISPLSGATVVFSTLEGRPSAAVYDEKPELQEFMTATDIRIVLNRINTFRDEVFGDPNVLKSYYYAISDISIGGRCQCWGHASECKDNICKCEHNTTGVDCQECLPLFNDRPWKVATSTEANECRPCNCNGLADKCFFDRGLYDRTGHGGHCVDCRGNAVGPHCEHCQMGYFKRHEHERCQPCNCNSMGSRTQQCDNSGTCHCKPGVTGSNCDRCLPNYYGFGPLGCRTCECAMAGSLNNVVECISESGTCRCKENVHGQNCDLCKPGFFGLNGEDPLGCTTCFCHGHSNSCTMSSGYYIEAIHTDFKTGLQKWTGVTESGVYIPLEFNKIGGAAGISSTSREMVYFDAPDRYLGDQRNSYNLFLTFDLRTGEDGARVSSSDLIIEGPRGLKIEAPITSQNNPTPRTITQNYKFRLSEHPSYQWSPSLSTRDFLSILTNITAIKIRGVYSYQGVGFINNVKLQSASRGSGRIPALNVERCDCPEGYVGQSCESCAPGFTREPGRNDPFGRCIPCNCNGHSDVCDSYSGRCICQHNTAGANCEICAPGFYGNALSGTHYDCKACPCPNRGQCMEMPNGEVACTECQIGYSGNRCEQCADGYFGDPEGVRGPRRVCEKCNCNENVDYNAIGICDRFTGECLKCIYNTAGYSCERCLPYHYGNALAYPRGQCKPCDCHIPGTLHGDGHSCNAHTGQCNCRPNIYGPRCDQCLDGYWNIDGVSGCERCDCNRIGSHNMSCNFRTGQCYCKPGVTGKQCDVCADKHYGFSQSGCMPCNCNPDGSRDDRCDPSTGQCLCKQNIEGRRCDRCAENRFLDGTTCIECPECYKLIQQTVSEVRMKVNELRILINYINNDPFGQEDEMKFRMSLHEVNQTVVRLLWDARSYRGGGIHGSSEEENAVKTAIHDVLRVINSIKSNVDVFRQYNERSNQELKLAEDSLNDIEQRLRDAEIKMREEGIILLRRALEEQHKQGHQSETLTRMAHEARVEAERQEKKAVYIEEILNSALTMSEEALRLAQQMTDKSGGTTIEMTIITQRITDLRDMKHRINQDAKDSLENAKRAYDIAISLFSEITNIQVIRGDTNIEHELNRLRQDAERLEREAREFSDKNQRFVQDLEFWLNSATNSYNSAQAQQQVLDELLANADTAKGIAEDAYRASINIFRDANTTLHLFQEFDENIQRSRIESEIAYKKAHIIRENINTAERKTYEARSNIANAEHGAREAKEVADRARRLAEDSLKALEKIMNETLTAGEKFITIKEESVKRTVTFEKDLDRLQKLEETAREDAIIIKEAQEKADDAKMKADSAALSLETAQEDLEYIMKQLGTMEGLHNINLDSLEAQLLQVENQLTSANVAMKFDQLSKFELKVTIWMDEYTRQLSQLHWDVENIRHINATIPRTCFKILNLEPTDPRL